MAEWIIQVDFKDNSYESNKGFIKDIIKRQHGLSSFDAVTQRWYNKDITGVEVQRIVSADGLKTIGIKVAGDKLADAIVTFVKYLKGVSVTQLVVNSIDKEVNEIIGIETRNFSSYIYRRVERCELSKDVADKYLELWKSAVSSYEYTKRGVEY